MRKIFKLLSVVFLLAFITSCDMDIKPSADAKQKRQTEQLMTEATSQVGMPAISNFTELKTFKAILELRDDPNLITHTYLVNTITGEVGQYLGQSIGYGIPAATQFTNPQKIAKSYSQGGFAILPQPDPNGLFMPTSTSATWVLLLDEKGVPKPTYVEPLIIVSPFKLK